MQRLFLGIGILLSFSQAAIALPDMSASDFLEWQKNNQTLLPRRNPSPSTIGPTLAHQSRQPEVLGGKISMTAFFNDNNVVTELALTYRPTCYFHSNMNCKGDIRFEKADKGNNQRLIQKVFGDQVLADFHRSSLMDSTVDSSGALKRWYQGPSFNYETSHNTNNTITHFVVVSKTFPQKSRITEFKYCEQSPNPCAAP